MKFLRREQYKIIAFCSGWLGSAIASTFSAELQWALAALCALAILTYVYLTYYRPYRRAKRLKVKAVK